MKKLMFTIAMAAALEGFASFSYQGALKLADGSAVSVRSVTIEFRLYDAPGNDAKVLWAGRQAVVVSPSNGLFNVEIGGGSMSPADPFSRDNPPPTIDEVIATSKDLYIGLTVDGSSGEIRPRQRILPVPTASFARNVNQASADFTVSSNLHVKGSTGIEGKTTFDGEVTVSGKLKIGSSEVMPVPIGGIIMWSQSTPPDGEGGWARSENSFHWAICDGATVNGVQTPDLVDRFVVGTTPNGSSEYKLGDCGGAAQVTLTTNQIPAHAHTIVLKQHWWNMKAGEDHRSAEYFGYNTPNVSSTHRTNVDGGSGQPHENRPPYYALFYIMRVR